MEMPNQCVGQRLQIVVRQAEQAQTGCNGRHAFERFKQGDQVQCGRLVCVERTKHSEANGCDEQ